MLLPFFVFNPQKDDCQHHCAKTEENTIYNVDNGFLNYLHRLCADLLQLNIWPTNLHSSPVILQIHALQIRKQPVDMHFLDVIGIGHYYSSSRQVLNLTALSL